MRLLAVISLLAATSVTGAAASEATTPPPAPAVQIAGAVLSAPEEMQAAATVLGWSGDGELVTLRQGEGMLTCLADDPTDDRFHTACYHDSLEPFMARGRALRAEGLDRAAVEKARQEEVRAGTLAVPGQLAALYSITGAAGSFDPATGEVEGGTRLYVLYIPFATAASTGLSTAPAEGGAPWLMADGKPWAHVMILPPEPEKEPAEAP